MNHIRYLPAATLGLDGRIYVTGGSFQLVTETAESYQTVGLNRAPVAVAGLDQELECVAGGADAVLDAAGSSDPDGDPLTYEWIRAGEVVATGASATVRFEAGTHLVTLRVTDDNGATAEDQVEVTVVDTQAPVIHLDQRLRTLWPPNHSMHLVAVVGASDACDPAPALDVTVSSNEPDDDSDVAPDWIVEPTAEGVLVWVRAERRGSGNGRVYTIEATASDHAGNAAAAQTFVMVGERLKEAAQARGVRPN